MFGMCGVEENVGRYILENYSMDLGPDGRSGLEAGSSLHSMSELVDTPLGLIDQEKIVCLDLDYFKLRLTRCLLNLVNEVHRRNGRADINAALGEHFEEWCTSRLRLIQQVRRQEGDRVVPPAELGDSKLDALYLAGRKAIAFEFKSGLLPISAAFGFDADTLASAINSRYLEGDKAPKGFAQLKLHIATMMRQRHSLKLGAIDEVIACLVVEDDLMSTTPAYLYTVLRAEEMFRDLSVYRVTPVLIHHEDLHGLLSRAKVASPATVLLRIARNLRNVDITVKNTLLRLFPEEQLERRGNEVDLRRPTPLMDQVLAQMEQVYKDPVTATCTSCDGTMTIHILRSGERGWWCDQCKASPPFAPTEEELEEAIRRFEDAVRRYRQL